MFMRFLGGGIGHKVSTNHRSNKLLDQNKDDAGALDDGTMPVQRVVVDDGEVDPDEELDYGYQDEEHHEDDDDKGGEDGDLGPEDGENFDIEDLYGMEGFAEY
jgi:hypothetical protein